LATLREEQKRRTRRRILQAAARLFSEQGILATTTLEVARSAGVAHGTVFAHFPGREDLVAEVISSFGVNTARRIRDLARGTASVREVLSAHLEGIARDEDLYARIVQEGPLLPHYARSVLVGVQSAISHHLNEVLSREIASGRARRVDPALFFNTWLGLIHHYVSNRDILGGSGSILEECGPDLIEHMLELIAP
jgi:AcrR family transcriptional regulator